MRWSKLCDDTAEADLSHGMKPKIGVMVSCSEPIGDYARATARELGEAIRAPGYALTAAALRQSIAGKERA